MISFEANNVPMPTLDFALVENWLQQVALSFDKKIGNLNYLFCDDNEILRVNQEFLGHDYFTDIITFDYSRGDKVGGDLFISLDTVKSNSELFGESYSNELLRVIVHGLLHLCGINDKEAGERAQMEQCENSALSLLGGINKEGKHEV